MKKILSLICVLALTVGILAIGVVGVSAAESPQTELNLKTGDKVSYALALSDVPERIVGCDFSVYYDSSAFSLESVADFNDSTNDEEWQATINPDLDGEVRGNWSILRGVDFSKKRNIVTLNLIAKRNAKAHISYFVRYMYDDSVFDSDDRPQIDQYRFTCDVKVNGEPYMEDAPPELNVEETQNGGMFDNSRTGDSDDADPALSGDNISENGGVANERSDSGNSADDSDKTASEGATTKSGGKTNQPATTADKAEEDNTAATDAEGKAVVSSAAKSADSTEKSSGSPVMWFIIAAIVIIAGGCVAFVVIKGKKTAETKTDDQ